MIERRPALVLLALPFVYVAGALLTVFPLTAVAVPLAFAVTLLAALLAGARDPAARAGGTWTFLGLLVLTGVGLFDPGLAGGASADVAAGVLLGLPAIAVSLAARPRWILGARLLLYGWAVVWGLLLLAAASALSAGPTAVTGSTFVSSFATTAGNQALGLLGLLDGSGYTLLPLHALTDPAYAALVGVSGLGLLLLIVPPQSGDGRPLPVATPSAAHRGPAPDPAALAGLSEAQRATFRERTEGTPPLTTWPPGLIAVLASATATATFAFAAYVRPYGALLGAVVGALVVAAFLMLVVEVPGVLERRGKRPQAAGSEPPTLSEIPADTPR